MYIYIFTVRHYLQIYTYIYICMYITNITPIRASTLPQSWFDFSGWSHQKWQPQGMEEVPWRGTFRFSANSSQKRGCLLSLWLFIDCYSLGKFDFGLFFTAFLDLAVAEAAAKPKWIVNLLECLQTNQTSENRWFGWFRGFGRFFIISTWKSAQKQQ